MKKYLFIIVTLVLSVAISSCKKEKKKDPDPAPASASAPTPAAADPLYIKFTLDGVAKSFTSTNVSINTGFGGGSSTSSGFFNLTDDISINLNMPLDSIMGSDLQSLVGQKIRIGSCGGCPTNIYLNYAINDNDYQSSGTYNVLPSEYIKFNTVTFQKNLTVFNRNVNQYYVTGEFNLKLSYGTDIKNATNGTFALIFRESKH
jgi:hypothetical protein